MIGVDLSRRGEPIGDANEVTARGEHRIRVGAGVTTAIWRASVSASIGFWAD